MKSVTKATLDRLAQSIVFRRKTVRSKVFINFALMTIAVTALLGITFYMVFSSTYLEEVRNANKSMLETESKIINEKIIDNVRGFSVNLVMDPQWANVQYFFDYATQQSYDLSNIYKAYNYLKLKVSSNWETVDSVGIYFQNMDMLLSPTTGMDFPEQNTSRYSMVKDIFSKMKDENLYEFWSDTQVVKESHAPEKSIVYYARLYPYGSDPAEAKGCVVISIHQSVLKGTINAGIRKWGFAFVINNENRIVAGSDGSSDFAREQIGVLQRRWKSGEAFREGVLTGSDNKKMLVSTVPLSNHVWQLVRIAPVEIWYHKVNTVKYFLLVVCVMIVSTSILLSRFTLNRIHNPLQRIVNYIKEMPGSSAGALAAKETDEYTVLDRAIVGLSEKVSEFEHVFVGNCKMLKQNFLEYILFHSTADINELYSFMHLISIKMPFSYFGVMLLELPGGGCDEGGEEVLRLNTQRLIDFIETYAQPGLIGYAVNIPGYASGKYISVVMNTKKEDREWVMERTMKVFNCLREYYKLDIKAGVGRIVEDLRDLKHSREDAETLIQYTYFNLGNSGILGDLTVLCREKSRETLPEDLLERCYKAIKKLDAPCIKKTMRQVTEAMKANHYAAGYCRTELGKIAELLANKMEKQTVPGQESKSIYDIFNTAGTVDELQSGLFSEFDRRANPSGEKTEENAAQTNKASELVCMAKEHAVGNLEKDISLLTVSEYIGVSPQYFSKIFKEETGENFIDYLTRERMNKAKRIIAENTEISIEELYNRVGYNSASYFIKKFRESYHMTPNTYRKIAREQPKHNLR